MPVDNWEQIKRIFAEASALEAAQRRTFVDRACAGDADLAEEVWSLLEADFEQGNALRTADVRGVPGETESRSGSSSSDPFVGQLLANRYEVLRPLGRGGMGHVYLARHVHIDRLDAVKILAPHLSNSREAVARFKRGARNLSQISHGHVCRVYDLTRTEDGLWLLPMEYVDGPNLAQVLDDAPVLGPRRALRLASQMALGLDAAHRKDVVHRDMKPANVMITGSGSTERVKLVDFDIAKTTRPGPDITDVAVRIGTPMYMSPEQLVGDEVGARSDLYSLGLILFLLCTGRLPFNGRTTPEIFNERLTRHPLALAEVSGRDDHPEGLQTLLDRMLAREPGDRPSSGSEVAGVLVRLVRTDGSWIRGRRGEVRIPDTVASSQDTFSGRDDGSSAIEVPSRSGPQDLPRVSRRTNRMRWASAFVVLALVAAGSVVAANRPDPPPPAGELESASERTGPEPPTSEVVQVDPDTPTAAAQDSLLIVDSAPPPGTEASLSSSEELPSPEELLDRYEVAAQSGDRVAARRVLEIVAASEDPVGWYRAIRGGRTHAQHLLGAWLATDAQGSASSTEIVAQAMLDLFDQSPLAADARRNAYAFAASRVLGTEQATARVERAICERWDAYVGIVSDTAGPSFRGLSRSIEEHCRPGG